MAPRIRGYTKGYFRYDRKSDSYCCPQCQALTQPVQKKANRKGDRYYNPAACAKCPAREKCTPATPYRTIVRGKFDDYTEEVDAFTKESTKIFAERKSMCEHPFGTVKRALGFTYFLTRGHENVRTESLLHFLAYSMKRLINIMGTEKLRIVLQG